MARPLVDVLGLCRYRWACQDVGGGGSAVGRRLWAWHPLRFPQFPPSPIGEKHCKFSAMIRRCARRLRYVRLPCRKLSACRSGLRGASLGRLGRAIAARRTAVWLGLTGIAGSLCWFMAFTLQHVALVFAVGQVEVIFSSLPAVLFFGECITACEGMGIALITLSVIAVVAFRQGGSEQVQVDTVGF